MNPLVTRHPRNTTQQLPPNHHEVQGESMSDHKANCIPKLDHIHNLLRESVVNLLNNKA